MGGGNGHYLGTKAAFLASSLDKNFNCLKKYYPVQLTPRGYLGPRGNTSKVRIIKTKDPEFLAQKIYDKLKTGGVETIEPTRRFTILGDGSEVQLRTVTSSPGSPAVEILVSNSSKIQAQKIHLVKI